MRPRCIPVTLSIVWLIAYSLAVSTYVYRGLWRTEPLMLTDDFSHLSPKKKLKWTKLRDFQAHKNHTAHTTWWKTIEILNTLDLWKVGGPDGFIPPHIWAFAVTHFCPAAWKKKVPTITELWSAGQVTSRNNSLVYSLLWLEFPIA